MENKIELNDMILTENDLFVRTHAPDGENLGVIENGKKNNNWLYWLIPGVICFLIMAAIVAIVLGLIPLYLSDSNNSDDTASDTASVGSTSLNNPTVRIISSSKRFKRAEGDSVMLTETSGATTLNCNNIDVDMQAIFMKGVTAGKAATNGETMMNIEATFTCTNNQIVQTTFSTTYLSGNTACFGLGNSVANACEPSGKALKEIDTCNLYKAYNKGLGKTAQGVPLDLTSTNYTLDGFVFFSETGMQEVYTNCMYSGDCTLMKGSEGCKKSCCINPSVCNSGDLCTEDVTFDVTQIVEVGYTDTFLEVKQDVPMLDDVWPCGEGDDICIKSYIVRKVDVEEKEDPSLTADMFPDIMI